MSTRWWYVSLILGLALCGMKNEVAFAQGGIKIRGHWVLEVRNRDGTLADRREFDNALTASGAAILARLLTRTNTIARWTIELGSPTDGPCAGGTFNGITTNSCFLVDILARPPVPGTAVFATLFSQIAGDASNQVVMKGHASVLTAGHIAYVATIQGLCVNTISIMDCNAAGIHDQFTSHQLRNAQGAPAPLAVTTGQVVQVTVTMSFCRNEACES